jgi:hypothetical protein
LACKSQSVHDHYTESDMVMGCKSLKYLPIYFSVNLMF